MCAAIIEGRIENGDDAWTSSSAADRQCIWVRRGLISRLACFNGFECGRCAVDQRIEDRLELGGGSDVAGSDEAGGRLAA